MNAKVSVADMQRLIAGELSLLSRIGYTALLLIALGFAGAIGSLWLTEPWLPLRTHVAFATMVAIALSWVAYSLWVLTRRQVLFAGHRIIAGRMAVAFCTIFVIGSLVTGIWGGGGRAAYGAAAFGVPMLAIAIGVLVSARRRFRDLMERRRALEAA